MSLSDPIFYSLRRSKGRICSCRRLRRASRLSCLNDACGALAPKFRIRNHGGAPTPHNVDLEDISITIFDDRRSNLLMSAPAASVSSLLLERRLRHAHIEIAQPKARRHSEERYKAQHGVGVQFGRDFRRPKVDFAHVGAWRASHLSCLKRFRHCLRLLHMRGAGWHVD